jgi:hypothetical protein
VICCLKASQELSWRRAFSSMDPPTASVETQSPDQPIKE